MPVRGCLAGASSNASDTAPATSTRLSAKAAAYVFAGHGGVLMAHELLQCLDVGAGRDGDGRERVAQGVEGQGAPVGSSPAAAMAGRSQALGPLGVEEAFAAPGR